MAQTKPVMTFKCYSCKGNSRYIAAKRKQEIVMELQTMETMNRPKPRTYMCEKCGAANRITMTSAEWSLIDYATG